MPNLILHPDELFLKGANRRFFYNTLISNLKSFFKGLKIEKIENGLWVENFPKSELERLQKIPGIANFAVCQKTDNDFETIKKAVENLEIPPEAKTFRVTAGRFFKKYPLRSNEMAVILGDLVAKKFGLKVDLKNFDLNIKVDVSSDHALVYCKVLSGAGGLPTGSSGKILCLLSGGLDSPVAAYKMMKRGAQVGLIHFQNETAVSEEVGKKIFDLAERLSAFQPKVELFMIPFGELQRQVIMKVPSDSRMIITRRLFLKIAAALAKANGYGALVTGDSLGQVASQTLENMAVIYEASDMLKLAPLIGDNKKDIMDIAKLIGTYEISIRPYEDCCSLFVAKHPKTKARLREILKIENNLSIPDLGFAQTRPYSISMN